MPPPTIDATNAPAARLLGHDTLDEIFIDRHADALVGMLLGPDGGYR